MGHAEFQNLSERCAFYWNLCLHYQCGTRTIMRTVRLDMYSLMKLLKTCLMASWALAEIVC